MYSFSAKVFHLKDFFGVNKSRYKLASHTQTKEKKIAMAPLKTLELAIFPSKWLNLKYDPGLMCFPYIYMWNKQPSSIPE
jgi:hypothetical protein